MLGERFQTTSAGGSDGFSVLFEMNTLFEEYVARMLKRALADTDLRVVSQGGRLYCLETDDRRGLFQTRPDILVKRGDEVVQVIDTKWKRIAARIDDPKQGVSQADVYQMMAYSRLYRCGRLTLCIPTTAL
ncbi:McrC family protein [Sphingomonas sp. WKB10]|nr:McrC family protein [Sphingomonas sp. WKB10]